MTWILTDPDEVIDDIKSLGPDFLEAWETISPVLLELPYPRSDELLRIKIVTDHTYQVMLFPHQAWVSYRVTDDVVRLLTVEEIRGDSV